MEEKKPTASKPSSKRETVVVSTPVKKVTLVANDEELVAVSPGQRNWRGIFIALLVIAAVLGLIVFSIFLLSPEDEGARVRGRRLTLSDVNGNGLKWRPFNGTWISDTELVFRDPSGGLSILNLQTHSSRILMTNSTFRQLNAEKFIVSPDLKYVLLISNTEETGARYHVYEVHTQNTFALSPEEGAREAPRLQRVLWAPNTYRPKVPPVLNAIGGGAKPQAIAFVHNNDLYYKPKVQSELVCRITSSGEMGVVYNGIPDWMYSHTPELASETITFSPDGSYLSYLMFNDSLVQKYEYTWIGESVKYPEVRSIHYPKANTLNPNVTVFIVNLTTPKFIFPQPIKLPSIIKNGSYVGGMVWVSSIDLSITFIDRPQNKSATVLCRAPQFNCKEIHTETVVDNGWVLPLEKPVYSKRDVIFLHSKNKTKIEHPSNITENAPESVIFLLKRLPVRDGDHGYYRHIVFISTYDLKAVPITMGRFEVTEILGWDQKRDIVYFMATPELKPGQRHLYKITIKLSLADKPNRIYISATQPTCLTCDNAPTTFRLIQNIREGNGTPVEVEEPNRDDDEDEAKIPNNCLFNKIYLSQGFSYYVQECLGPDSPSIYLVDMETNAKIFVLHNGDLLRNRLNQIAVPQIRIFRAEIRDGFFAQVRLFLPPGMKEEEEVAFPLILHIDAAPDSQLVSEKYHVDWNWYICSQRSMIVAQVDARGSGFQGELLRSQVKGKLGTIEIEDQLAVLTYLRDNLKFIDPTRICAYGLGYGGYAATKTLIDDSQRILQCAVAINPIVSFGYHNSFFTERYFPHNDEYLRSLQEADLTMKSGNLEGRQFLLIHGTADRIVHPQHSLMLARSLIDAGINFRQQVYTDADHNMRGVLFHLYKTLEWFIDDSFGPMDTNEWDPTGFFAFKHIETHRESSDKLKKFDAFTRTKERIIGEKAQEDIDHEDDEDEEEEEEDIQEM